jgi:hypothetical protein
VLQIGVLICQRLVVAPRSPGRSFHRRRNSRLSTRRHLVALAAVFSFFLIFAGTFDIIIAISVRREIRCGTAAIGGIVELRSASGRLVTTGAAPSSPSRGLCDRHHPRRQGHRVAFRVRELQHA